ncbi:hypothetical protein Tsp_11405 [Trichinella spiralis]|uniref:hypothetical protein n=1 Tax=Trichinella spiralis TaxID=6334 RepID=UPI0001EFE74A|nr:hypothetical protein Tsp_11405 [Trichinella spiralis]
MMPETEQHLAEPCSSSLLALYKTLPCSCVLGACFPPSIIAAKEYISKRNACPVLTSRRFCSRLAVSIAAQTERRPTMFDVGVPRHYLNNDLAVSLNLLQAFRPRTD